MAGMIWRAPEPLVLASASRTRQDLLMAAGIPVEAVPSHVDERRIEADAAGLAPAALASRLAAAKAKAVALRHPGRIVVGADQVLDLDGRVFHKPADAPEAQAHLARLQGRTHALHSAVAILCQDGVGTMLDAFVETARLTMRSLDASAIAAYVTLAGPERVTSSVGAYQAEGLGIHLFERIEGGHSTILGLPLIALTTRLRSMNLLAF